MGASVSPGSEDCFGFDVVLCYVFKGRWVIVRMPSSARVPNEDCHVVVVADERSDLSLEPRGTSPWDSAKTGCHDQRFEELFWVRYRGKPMVSSPM